MGYPLTITDGCGEDARHRPAKTAANCVGRCRAIVPGTGPRPSEGTAAQTACRDPLCPVRGGGARPQPGQVCVGGGRGAVAVWRRLLVARVRTAREARQTHRGDGTGRGWKERKTFFVFGGERRIWDSQVPDGNTLILYCSGRRYKRFCTAVEDGTKS